MVRRLSEEVRNDIKMYQAMDYEIGKETEAYIEMVKENKQSVAVHLFLALFFFWLWFTPNLAYYLVKAYTPKKKKIII